MNVACTAAGAVAAGRVADLVVLDADPVAGAASYRRVWSVVANGLLFDTTELARLREQQKAAGGSPR